ncbi:hypothetical protein VPH35_004514 [Triticum aestivum]|uniref:Uncharacterized protein n=1 Tax=Triticum urartu TaxID=4572 RepID=A0A8R7K3R1_TRIUA
MVLARRMLFARRFDASTKRSDGHDGFLGDDFQDEDDHVSPVRRSSTGRITLMDLFSMTTLICISCLLYTTTTCSVNRCTTNKGVRSRENTMPKGQQGLPKLVVH